MLPVGPVRTPNLLGTVTWSSHVADDHVSGLIRPSARPALVPPRRSTATSAGSVFATRAMTSTSTGADRPDGQSLWPPGPSRSAARRSRGRTGRRTPRPPGRPSRRPAQPSRAGTDEPARRGPTARRRGPRPSPPSGAPRRGRARAAPSSRPRRWPRALTMPDGDGEPQHPAEEPRAVPLVVRRERQEEGRGCRWSAR